MSANRSGIDPLTGLYNKSALPHLDKLFSQREQVWSIIMVDIDHFKLVNDIYGHLAGDEVLAHVGRTIKVNLKSSDYALRFGGDEFLIILPDTERNGALDLSQRLLFELSDMEFPRGLKISVSLGIAQSKSTDREMSDSISMADKALYRAKETGRGCFVHATDLGSSQKTKPDFSHMVNRREELLLLRKSLDYSKSKAACFCLLTGHQGIGKTRLVSEFINYCQFKDTPVYTISVRPVHEETGFFIIQAIKTALKHLSDEQLISLIHNVGEIGTSAAEQLDNFSFLQKRYTRETPITIEKIRYRKDLGNILKEVSIRIPFVLILDNLQWASSDCIEFAADIISSAPTAKIFYIAISRNLDAMSSLKPVLTCIHSEKIDLTTLNHTDTRTMIAFATRTPEIPANLLEYIMRQSGGNPLFLNMLISWCVRYDYCRINNGRTSLIKIPEEEKLPETIDSIISIMLTNCSAIEIKTITRAAIIGNTFTLDILSKLTDLDEYYLAELLSKFVDMKFLHDTGDAYTFCYGVMCSHLISGVSPSLRRILHSKVAVSVVNSIVSDSDIENKVIAIAYHSYKGNSKNDALIYSEKAALATFKKGLYYESIHWYKIYLELASDNEEPIDLFRAHINIGQLFSITGKADMADKYINMALALTDDSADLCEAYHRFGECYQRKSMYSEAANFFEMAIIEGHSTEQQTDDLIGNMVGSLLGLSFIFRTQRIFPLAVKKLELAKELLDQKHTNSTSIMHGIYYARMADIETDKGSPVKALEFYHKGLEICRNEKDHTGEALILNNMHDLYARTGDYDLMLEAIKQVIRLTNKANDKYKLAIGYYNLAELYTQLNMLDLARKYFQLYIELNTAINNRLGMAYGQLGLGKLFALNDKRKLATEYFLNASSVFRELGYEEMNYHSQIETVKTLIAQRDFHPCTDILDGIPTEDIGYKLRNMVMHLKGVLLLCPYNDKSIDYNTAIDLLNQSISDTSILTINEICYTHGNLFHAFENSGHSKKALEVLSESLRILEARLSSISSEPIRNSILSRSDVVKHFDICREMGITGSILNR